MGLIFDSNLIEIRSKFSWATALRNKVGTLILVLLKLYERNV